MAAPLAKPKRRNPLKRIRLPLTPPSARSRQAYLLTAAAAEGRFVLPACADCNKAHYPPRDLCPYCLSERVVAREFPPYGRVVAATVLKHSTDRYFRERLPWRIGTIEHESGAVVVAHLHGDVGEGEPIRLALYLDKGGEAVALALPKEETPNMADDPILREFTADPKHRRVLVTDGRSALGLAMAEALAAAGAAIIFVGIANPWKPFPGEAKLRALPGVEFVPLDLTETDSVVSAAGSIGAKVDILVNTADHVRPGGLMTRRDVTIAREEMEIGYFGMMRLAQAFGPVMRLRGADGTNSAAAFVNILSIYARMNWPPYGAYSAMQAAMLSAAQALRAELRPGGVKVVNIFVGPMETEWFQTLPPPKVTMAQIAAGVIAALQRGVEESYIGDVAQDLRARLLENPKAVERELANEA